MAKSIVKEIIIILLLTLAIILILGVLLYRYTAYNKVLPEEVSYTTPEDVRNVLSEINATDENQTAFTYQVTASDLKSYERTKEYVEGRRNPFASVESEQNASSGNQSTGSQTAGGNNSNTNSNTNSNNSNNSFDFSNIDMNTILKMKSVMEKLNNSNDPRANLLNSLKPYLRNEKKEKLSQYANLINFAKIAEIMKNDNKEQE